MNSQRTVYRFSDVGADTDMYGNKIIRMEIPKWASVRRMVREQKILHFSSDEELTLFLEENPQYEINQRFPGTASVELYARGYAETEMNAYGRRVPIRWFSEEETQEYLASLES